MLIFALVGLAANVAGMLLLRAGAKESINVRGAYLEVVGDLLGLPRRDRGGRWSSC